MVLSNILDITHQLNPLGMPYSTGGKATVFSHLFSLLKKLFSDKAPKGKPLVDFTAKQQSIATNVHNLSLELPEPLLALILLHSLPPSYNTLCTVIARSTKLEKLTFDLVEAQILAEEQCSNSSSGLNTMFSKKVNSGKGRNGKGKSNRPT
jgi:hypothetical protein